MAVVREDKEPNDPVGFGERGLSWLILPGPATIKPDTGGDGKEHHRHQDETALPPETAINPVKGVMPDRTEAVTVASTG